jgi:hypothetical protein
MKSIKCKVCGLSNFPTDVECRRCGNSFLKPKTKREKRPRSFSMGSVLAVVVAGALGYYVYTGSQQTIDQVNAEEMKRAAAKPAERPVAPGLTRTEYDHQKMQSYAGVVRDSQSLADHNKHIEDTEKMMQQISNGK